MCVACHMCASDRNVIIPTPPTQPFPCVNVCKNSEFHRVVNDAGSKNIPIFLLETNPPFLTMDLAYLPTFYLHLLLRKPTFTYVYRKYAMDTMGTVPSLDLKQASRDLESPKRSAWQVGPLGISSGRDFFSVRGKHTFRPSSLGAKWFRFRMSIDHPLGLKEGTLWKPAGRV